MARYRVSCTQKREKHEHIVSLGCYGPGNTFHNFSEAEVISRIEKREDTFYSESTDGHDARGREVPEDKTGRREAQQPRLAARLSGKTTSRCCPGPHCGSGGIARYRGVVALSGHRC
jgi:hypothetical protein